MPGVKDDSMVGRGRNQRKMVRKRERDINYGRKRFPK